MTSKNLSAGPEGLSLVTCPLSRDAVNEASSGADVVWAVHRCQGGLMGILAWPIEAGPWGAHKEACLLPDGQGECVMGHF